MEVCEPSSGIIQNRPFYSEGYIFILLKQVTKIGCHVSITSTGSLESGRKQMQRNWTMCGCRRSPISWHSLTNFFMTFSTPSFWTFIKLLCNVFPAQIIPLSSSFSTLPYDPVPSFWGSFVERVTFLRTNCLSPRALWN